MNATTIPGIITSAVLVAVLGFSLSTAAASPGGASGDSSGICPELDSGKIDTTDDPQIVPFTAPAGMMIVGYCVKAGSEKNGNGPVYVQLNPPTYQVRITHPSGKAVSHYSIDYADTSPAGDGSSDSPSDPSDPSAAPPAPAPSDPGGAGDTPADPAPGGPDGGEEPGADSPTPPGASVPADPGTPPAPAPAPAPAPGPVSPAAGFDWNWTYPAPSCSALTVRYPADLPAGQSNDVNVRLTTSAGSVNLNFHNNGSTWSGTRQFVFAEHPNWPQGISDYRVVWTQVGGTNYHWTGSVSCP